MPKLARASGTNSAISPRRLRVLQPADSNREPKNKRTSLQALTGRPLLGHTQRVERQLDAYDCSPARGRLQAEALRLHTPSAATHESKTFSEAHSTRDADLPGAQAAASRLSRKRRRCPQAPNTPSKRIRLTLRKSARRGPGSTPHTRKRMRRVVGESFQASSVQCAE